MRTIKFLLLSTMTLCAATVHAEQVAWLKENVQALMKYEDFPTAKEAIQIIPDEDPLADLKRTEVLHTLVSLSNHYPIFEDGKWQNLSKSYKRTFMKMGGRWPLRKEDKVRLEKVGFASYPLVMETYFPEAFKLKPTRDGSHKEEAAIRAVLFTGGSLLALFFLVLFVQKWRNWKTAK